MADEIKHNPDEAAGTPSGAQPAGTSAALAGMPEHTMVMHTDQVDRTMVISDESPDRTIVLSAENGITKVSPDETQSVFGGARTRIQNILHKPSSILSALSGTVKRDVGAEIEGMDHHRKRDEVGHLDEGQSHLTDLEDRFEIERKLAEGSRYEVSIGEDIGLERQVAVYSLRDENLLDPDERASFILEAEISAQLDHPSILPVYSINRDYRGGLHSAVKLTDGTDLRKYLNRITSHYRSAGFHAAEEAASLGFRLELILGISDGLVYAHSRGVVHADLNPQNVMIGEYHEVYIKGWGFARFLSGQNGAAQTKHKPHEANDPRFIAPELISGAEPTVCSDVYALGMILYELVTLHPPFPDAPAPEILENLRNGVQPTIEHRFGGRIDPDMRAIIQKAIAPDPEKRYQSVSELAEDIRRFLHSDEVSVRKISLSKRFAKLLRAHHREVFFFFLTLICLVGALLVYNIINDVRLAQISYLDDHVLGKAQAACRKTAHQFNLQAEKFTAMLESIKFETEFLLSGHMKANEKGASYLAPPNEEAINGTSGVQTEYSPPYADSVSFYKVEVERMADLDDPMVARLGMIQPTLFRYMLQAPLNAFVAKEPLDKLVNRLTQSINPIFRIHILLKDGASLYYPYTVKTESPLVGGNVWYDQAVSSRSGQAHWNIPAKLEHSASGTERVVLPVSILLGQPDDPVGAAAILVSGRHFDQILTKADNFQRGLVSQFFISKDFNIKLERVNNGPDKAPTVNLEKGLYPDPWLPEWLDGKEYGSVIRKEPGGSFVYCCALVPAMEEWYVEKIRLQEFLRDVDSDQKGGLR